MTFEFALLGDLEVRVDGVLVDIGHVKQRAVLVALLAEPGRPVPLDRLADRVWGDQTPLRAKDTLYVYLSKLRQVLDIGREPGGYRLRADSVDLHRFRALVEQARGQTGERALELFDEALGLWRGPALAGLDSPWLAAFREELHVERVEAELDRNDLAIELGRTVLPELLKAAEERPVDERLAGQLILALHRAGNSAEALRHYEALRRRLAEELGVDPGAPLRALHARILAAEPTRTPRQLPAPQQWFTGRETELADVRGEGVTVIAGAGGVGKTALAVQWAHQHLDDFPDGQLYVDLRGFDPSGEPLTTDAALRGFLDALGEPGGPVSADRYRSLLADKRVLILLDNARDTGQVTGLLPGNPSCAVIVTSRNRMPGLLAAGAHLLPLDVLGASQAREFLQSRLGRAGVAVEPGDLSELVWWCGGLPLALSIVAARAAMDRELPLSALADELAECRLDALDAGEAEANLRTVFSWSRDALSAEAAELFALLGLIPSPDASLAAIDALSARPRVRMVLRELENAHLVQQHVPGRYRMHDLVRLYAADLAGKNTEALRRFADHLVRRAGAGALTLEPHRPLPELEPCERFPDAAAAMRWFDEEHESLLAVQRVAAEQGWHETTWLLARTLNHYHRRRGRTADELTTWHLGLSAAEQLGDRPKQAAAHLSAGLVYAQLSRDELAQNHLTRSLELHDEEDFAGRAGAHRAIAWARERAGDLAGALEHALHTLNGFRKADLELREAEALNEVGWRYACLGRYAEAADYCEQAMALNRKLGHAEGEAATLDSLAHIAFHDGRPAAAIEHYHESLEVYRQLDNSYEEATVLHHLGDVHAALDQRAQARELWDQALTLYLAQGRTDDAASLVALLDG
ncbi:AfsR/SARP family transcriptional regulator [Lentzea aerocolonigenes]|uniref:AfsR/SARP family transcriptional regulator n=1 Tax=Lentzea aerocolonigenes TaxID=68170 RepID=UPI0004C4383A|nr:BTAD domain-containing putative transcriptional regulator [Lentzea aerocolonigenes]MCP2244996.1 DNA-binding transcriptional activator of the SARP family [Lentzea aerocolonigenes]